MHFPPGLPNLAGTTQRAIQRACGPVMADYAWDGIPALSEDPSEALTV